MLYHDNKITVKIISQDWRKLFRIELWKEKLRVKILRNGVTAGTTEILVEDEVLIDGRDYQIRVQDLNTWTYYYGEPFTISEGVRLYFDRPWLPSTFKM